MKKDIHPKYEKTILKCACGNEIETRTTVGGEILVELCSACHPFYTGKQKFVDTAGRVDKFRARMEAAEAKKAKTGKTADEKTPEKSNAEKLAEIKAQVATEPKPMEVTQEATSVVEIAAAESLDAAADAELAESTKAEDNQ